MLFAVATRTMWDRDAMIFPDLRGYDIDPTVTGLYACKGGIDATKPAGEPFSERNRPSTEVLERFQLDAFLSPDRLARIPSDNSRGGPGEGHAARLLGNLPRVSVSLLRGPLPGACARAFRPAARAATGSSRSSSPTPWSTRHRRSRPAAPIPPRACEHRPGEIPARRGNAVGRGVASGLRRPPVIDLARVDQDKG